jgi:superoxide reductase
MEQKFYVCERCGNIVAMVKKGGGTLVCCGQKMTEIVANTVDASKEKHVPVYEKIGGTVTVKVGSAEHPMTEPHYIEWILLETKAGKQRKVLTPADKPEATFFVAEDDEVVAVYAYCNLHGLWKA